MAAPRGAPPVPHQARAPYLPLTPTVPEPSMFFPSTRSFPAPTNPGSANSSLGPPCSKPPMPTAAPSHQLLRPQSEFSRVFHQTEATVFLQGSDTAQFELLERHVQFNTSEIMGHGRAEQNDHGRDWRGGSRGTRGFPQNTDNQLEAAPVQPVAQKNTDFPAPHHDMATPRLRPLPQYSSSSVTVTTAGADSARAFAELPSVPQENVKGQNQFLCQMAGAPEVEGSPSIPPELMSLLSWQNEQLRRLQDQVQQLLAASPQSQEDQNKQTPPAVSTDSPFTSSSPPLRRCQGDRGSQLASSNSMPNMMPSTASVATNTSSLWPDIQKGLARLREVEEEEDEGDLVIRKSEVMVPREESISQPSIHLDLPEYQDSPSGDRRPANMTSWSSPVLGESVSMYEDLGRQAEAEVVEDQEEVAELYHNILGQVKRLLAKEDNDVASPPPPAPLSLPSAASSQSAPTGAAAPSLKTAASAPPSLSAPPNPRVATLARLKEMGVSFINPSEPQLAEQSVFLPRAQLPTQSVFQGASTDSSLDISSLALKYLDDSQLNNLALRHQQGEAKKQVKWGEQGQSHGTELSMASHQFLARHGLAGSAENDPGTLPSNQVPVSSARQQRNLDQHHRGSEAQVYQGAQYCNQAPATDNRIFPRVPLPPQRQQESHPNNLPNPFPADPIPNQRAYPLPDQRKNAPGLQMAPGPHPQMKPGAQMQVMSSGAEQMRPGPHVQMAAPGTLVDRVLDITAIQQQPKLL